MTKRFLTFLSFVFAVQASANDILIYKPNGSVVVPGYRTYFSNVYVPTEKNLEVLMRIKQAVTFVNPISFTSESSSGSALVCRMSYPIYAPGKISFESFIEGALYTELNKAMLLKPDASLQIKGRLDAIDFSSFGSGKWTVQATFSAEGKEPLTVKHEYAYPISGGAVRACGEVTSALVPAIQEFLYALYSHPGFVDLVK